MPIRSVQRLAVLAAALAFALSFPLAASATITGACTGTGTATSGGADLTTQAEWHVKKADVGGGSGQGPAAKSASVGIYAFGFAIPLASGTDPEGKTSGSVDGVSVSALALIGKRFTVAGSADNGCSGQIEIIIDDVDPLFTLLGGGGAALGVVGGLLVLRTMRGGKGIFKRLLDAIYGIVGGGGAALALTQFDYIDATSLLGLGLVIAAALFAFVTCGLLGGGKKKPPPVVSGSATASGANEPLGARGTVDTELLPGHTRAVDVPGAPPEPPPPGGVGGGGPV